MLFVKKLLENFTIALLILIVVIPEGLSMTAAVSISQATMQLFVQNKTLANEFDCSEKTGQIDQVICGQTGIITTEKMFVSKVLQNDKILDPDLQGLADEQKNILIQSILVNNACSVSIVEQKNRIVYSPVGNMTECALLNWVQKSHGVSIHKEIGSLNKIYSVEFNSLNKCSVVVEHDSRDFVRIHIKGSPSKVLPHCIRHLQNDVAVPLDLASLEVKRFCKDGVRAIAFAYKELTLAQF